MSRHGGHHIPSLDGWRAISIVVVLLGHLAGTRGFPQFATSDFFHRNAQLGVTVGPQYMRSLGPRARVSVGGRLGVALFYDQLHHYSGDEPEPVTDGHLLPGARADVVGALRFAENAGLFMSLGPELTFGKTTVYVQGAEATTLPPLRLTTALGLRLGF